MNGIETDESVELTINVLYVMTCESQLLIDSDIFRPLPAISATYDTMLGPEDGAEFTWEPSAVLE